MAEQRAGMRQADLVLGGTDILLGTLKDKGFSSRSVRRSCSRKSSTPTAWFKGKLWFADNEDKFVAMWRAVPYTAACINTNLVKANELKSYWDLSIPSGRARSFPRICASAARAIRCIRSTLAKISVPEYLKRLYGEMDVTISRNLPQIADWIAGGKFAIAIGGVDCDDLAVKGLPVVPIHFEGFAAVGAGTDPASGSPHRPMPTPPKFS